MAPIVQKPAENGIYVGHDGRPADVLVADPLFLWTVHGRYRSGPECKRKQSNLESRGLRLSPSDATVVAYTFARCLEENDALLQPNPRLK